MTVFKDISTKEVCKIYNLKKNPQDAFIKILTKTYQPKKAHKSKKGLFFILPSPPLVLLAPLAASAPKRKLTAKKHKRRKKRLAFYPPPLPLVLLVPLVASTPKR